MKCGHCCYTGRAKRKIYLSSTKTIQDECPECGLHTPPDRTELIKGYCKDCVDYTDDAFGIWCYSSTADIEPQGYCHVFKKKK